MTPVPHPVLARYPAAVAGLAWSPHPAGGFSGAAVWRGDLAGRPAFALKAWPPGYPADRLTAIHHLMTDARARAGLAFVPAVVPALSGTTVVEHAGRAWDVTAWMPGAADFRDAPSEAKLTAACAALASLHRAWAPPAPLLAPCPGVHRRLAVLADFTGRPFDQPASPLVRRALDVLPARVAAAAAALRPWADRPLPIQPCLCDVWHDHVLFTGDAVTGLIDYGEVKPDHPAVDLARLLGDLAGDAETAFRRGLGAYRAAGLDIDADFVRLLDRTGVVCAAVHWVKELTSGTAPPGAEERLTRLLDRLAVFICTL